MADEWISPGHGTRGSSIAVRYDAKDGNLWGHEVHAIPANDADPARPARADAPADLGEPDDVDVVRERGEHLGNVAHELLGARVLDAEVEFLGWGISVYYLTTTMKGS